MKQETPTDSDAEWQRFRSGIAYLAIPLTPKQVSQLRNYWHLLIKWSNVIHLTSANDYPRIPTRHILDSLLPLSTKLIRPDEHLCDFGSGAGFPGIPLAIALPSLKVTLVESNFKKTTFLKHLISELDLDNTTIIHERIENLKSTHQQAFTVGTVRAVSSLNTLIPLCFPLLTTTGRLICYKGPDYQRELDMIAPGFDGNKLNIVRISAPQLPLATVLVEIYRETR